MIDIDVAEITDEQLAALSNEEVAELRERLEDEKNEDIRKVCEASFYNFFLHAWEVLNPAIPLVDNWHIELFCNEIQSSVMRVIRHEPKMCDVIINTPPKSAKSQIFSVALPAWVWIHAPHLKFITCSYSPELADRDCGDSRRLITSEWYQELFGHKYQLTNDAATFLETDKGGQRRTTSPRSSKTGHKADIIIADDPNAVDDRYSQADRDLVARWWNETMGSRLDNQTIGLKIVIQQRIDDFDLTGYLRKEQGMLYGFLSLPADLSEGDLPWPVALKKFYKDGLMFPGRMGRDVLKILKMQLRSGYSGQINQRPTVAGGRIIKDAWFRTFTPRELPALEAVIISVDASLTDGDGSCLASIQVWGCRRPDYYMLYDYSERMTAIQNDTQLKRIEKLYPNSIEVIEQAANGFYLTESCEKRGRNVYRFIPAKFGGKDKRGDLISPLWEMGYVHVADSPHNTTIYKSEITSFPHCPYADRFDAMSQALLFYSKCMGGSAQFTGRMPGQV
jgi:phage terminase large subunit-like protein